MIILLFQTSCENSVSSNKEIGNSNPDKIDSTIALERKLVADSIVDDSIKDIKKVPKEKDKSTPKEKKDDKTEDNSINIEDALDVNKYKSVRDDPDYFGTPCEYVNSKCIRHNHKNYEEQPNNLEDDL